MSEHPLESLSAYLDGELQAAERNAVEAHLADCPGCRTVIADLQCISRAVASEEAPAVPPGLARRIGRQLGPRLVGRKPSGGRWWRGAPLTAAAALAAGTVLWLVWQAEDPTQAPSGPEPGSALQQEAKPEQAPPVAELAPAGELAKGAAAKVASESNAVTLQSKADSLGPATAAPDSKPGVPAARSRAAEGSLLANEPQEMVAQARDQRPPTTDRQRQPSPVATPVGSDRRDNAGLDADDSAPAMAGQALQDQVMSEEKKASEGMVAKQKTAALRGKDETEAAFEESPVAAVRESDAGGTGRGATLEEEQYQRAARFAPEPELTRVAGAGREIRVLGPEAEIVISEGGRLNLRTEGYECGIPATVEPLFSALDAPGAAPRPDGEAEAGKKVAALLPAEWRLMVRHVNGAIQELHPGADGPDHEQVAGLLLHLRALLDEEGKGRLAAACGPLPGFVDRLLPPR